MSLPATKLVLPGPSRCLLEATAMQATLFADTAPAARYPAPADGQAAAGFEIGWDYAHYRLTPPPEALTDGHPLRQGWQAGGDMPVATDDPRGVKSAEPFFELRAEVAGTNAVAYLHGRSGRIRFDADWEPLLPRWIRSLRQLLQKRYQL